jgi:hypothetical protein
MNYYVSLSLTKMKSAVHLHALYSPRTALRTFTPRRDQLVICGQYLPSNTNPWNKIRKYDLKLPRLINIIKLSRAINHVSVKLKLNVSETNSVSIIMVDVISGQKTQQDFDINIGKFWSLLTSTLMMETQLVSKTFICNLTLTRG